MLFISTPIFGAAGFSSSMWLSSSKTYHADYSADLKMLGKSLSFRFHPRSPDHLAPLVDLASQISAHLLGRAGIGVQPEPGKTRDQVGHCHGTGDFGVEPLNQRARRFRGRDDAVPGHDFE